MEPDSGRADYLHVATLLPIRRWRSVPQFLLLSNQVRTQVRAMPGLIAEAVTADLPRRFFYTYTIWRDRAAMRDFLNQGPHAEAMRRFDGWRGPLASTVEWQSSTVAIDWSEARRRLENPTFRFPD